MKRITTLILTLFTIISITNAQVFLQKGIDIYGEGALDQSGNPLCMPDKNTVAIGAPFNDGNGSNSGHVRIYRWNGSAWVQKGVDINGEAAGDVSGWSVSMPDSNTIAIGASSNDGNGSNSGHVRIYRWNGSTWLQKGIDIDGEAANDYSGLSISMLDSNTLAIGASWNFGNGNYSGHVRIYRWNGSAWVQKGVDIDGEAAGDFSGSSVSMPDSNTVAIGAIRNDANGTSTRAGHVRIYRWNGNLWIQKGIDIDGKKNMDELGASVSMADSNTIAIGVARNHVTATDAGLVRIYRWKRNTWVQIGDDINGKALFDHFGGSVSMPDINTVAIGAPENDGNGRNVGYIQVYAILYTPTTSSFSVTACNSYTVPSGDKTYTVSQIVTDTILNHLGNDSIMTINVTINNSSMVRDVQIACNSFTWPLNEVTYTSSTNSPIVTLTSMAGCDSMVTLNLTINNSNSKIDEQVACNNYTWPLNGVTYTSSTNSPTITLRNVAGCDSLVTLNLTINNSSTSKDVQVACNRYTWPLNGVTYTSSTNSAMVIFKNAVGCDSVVNLNLTINMVDVSVTNTSPKLTANATLATYQWLNCGNSFAAINGATNQNYIASTNGRYAVQVTQKGCTDTSVCVVINNVGILENDFGNAVRVYPNPTNGEISIDLGTNYNEVAVIITNLLGQEIFKKNYSGSNLLQLSMPKEPGVYFLEVRSADKKAVLKVIKE